MFALLGVVLVGAPELDRPLPGRVDLADLVGRVEDHAAGREVGPLDVPASASPAAAPGYPAAPPGRWQTSLRLCGGMFVAIPTAIPDAPLTSRFGNCAGRTSGSSVVAA